MSNRLLRRLILASVVAVIAVRCIAAVWVNLLPEEAYYWMYAKRPATGYYDHPPMVAWTIFLGIKVLGDTELGVRLVTLLLGLGSIGLMDWLGRAWIGRAAGWGAAAFLAVLPGYHFNGVLTTPDAPLIFFTLVVLVAVTAAVQSGHGAWWYLAGIGLGGALLSKYTGLALAVSTALFLLLDRDRRRWFRRPQPYLALVLAFVTFLPVILWNARHEWASFRFQTSGRMAQDSGSLATVAEFLGYQLLLMTPAVLAGVVVAVWFGFRQNRWRRSALWQFALCYSVPLLVIVGFYAFRTELKMNWLLPGYLSLLPATVGLVRSWLRRSGSGGPVRAAWRWFVQASLAAAVALDVAVLGYLTFPLPGLPRISRVHPWPDLGRRVEQFEEALEAPFGGDHFIIGEGKYAIASELAFYMRDPAEGAWRHVTSQVLLGEPGLNYAYWIDPQRYLGRNAVYVAESDDLDELPALVRCFASIGEPRTILDTRRWGIGKRFFVVECLNYLGPPAPAENRE